MQRELLFVAVCLILVSVSGCKKSGGSGANPFIGKWTVNPELSIAEGKKSAKYAGQPQAKMLGFISAAMDSPSLEISGDEMVFVRGQERTAQAYTVKSRDGEAGTMTVTAKTGGKEVEIVFTLLEDGYMNFKSDTTDDRNYYIWGREAAGELN